MSDLVGRADDVPLLRRLAEAIAWCEPRADLTDPAGSLRDDQLRPRVLETDRATVVNRVLSWRASRLRNVRPVAEAGLRGGRLLVYFPDQELSDGAAEVESGGFFDVNNAPAWDTWVGLFRDEDDDYLVSWAPGPFLELVGRGVWATPRHPSAGSTRRLSSLHGTFVPRESCRAASRRRRRATHRSRPAL